MFIFLKAFLVYSILNCCTALYLEESRYTDGSNSFIKMSIFEILDKVGKQSYPSKFFIMFLY